MSSNLLSGPLPSNILRSRTLTTFGAALNCFTGEIPTTICEATNLINLLLSGLSLNCAKTRYIMMSGSIPSCIFTLPNIESLFVSANNLYGTLPSDIMKSSSRLIDLSVSYNNLKGTIPDILLHTNFDILDLANNKFNGLLSDYVVYKRNFNQTYFGHSLDLSIGMKINRLSGRIPSRTTEEYNKVDILNGNLFDCFSAVPRADVSYGQFSCGSEELDECFYLLLCVFVLVVVYITLACKSYRNYFLRPYNAFFRYLFSCFEELSLWHNAVDLIPDSNIQTKYYLRTVGALKRLGFIATCSTISLMIIIFPALKSDTENITYYEQYRWFVSVAFLRGVSAAIVLLAYWFIIVLLVVVLIYIVHTSLKRDLVVNVEPVASGVQEESSKSISHIKFRLYAILIILLDSAFVFGINFGYVLILMTTNASGSTISQVQFLLAVVYATWELVVEGMFKWWARFSNVSILQMKRLSLLLLVFNGLVSPCIATITTDSRCFAEAIESPPAVDTFHIIPSCESFDSFSRTCSNIGRTIVPEKITPPFIYSNQCFSAILTNFIPPLVFTCVIRGVVIPLLYMLLTFIPVHKIPRRLDGVLAGMFWPLAYKRFDQVIYAKLLLVKQMLNLGTLLTFGVAHPLLTFSIALTMMCQMYFEELFTGRFLLTIYRANNNSIPQEVLKDLEDACTGIWRFPRYSVWVIVAMSAMFYGIGVFDIASDQVGLVDATSFIVIPVVLSLIIWGMGKFRYLQWFAALECISSLRNWLVRNIHEIREKSDTKVVELKLPPPQVSPLVLENTVD